MKINILLSLMILFIVPIFAAPPGAFDLISPDQEILNSDNVLFSWESSIDPEAGPVTYTVWISDNCSDYTKAFSTVDTYGSALIQENSEYWWYVSAEDQDLEKTDSDSISWFGVNEVEEDPEAFNLIFPIGNIQIEKENPELTWQHSHDNDPWDTVTYTVFLSTSSGMDTYVSYIAGETNSYSLGVLKEDMSYYWQVIASDTALNTRASAIENFKTFSFELFSPLSFSKVDTLNVTFSWDRAHSADTPTYEIRIREVSAADLYVMQNVGSDTQFVKPFGTDNDNSLFEWQVYAYDPERGTTRISRYSSQTFSVDIANENPYPFSLFSPSDSAILETLHPELVWNPSQDPDPWDGVSYTLHLLPDSGGEITVSPIFSNFYTLTEVENFHSYTWYITATDSGGLHSDSLEQFCFRITAPVAERELLTLSPNPMKKAGEMRISAICGDCVLKIFDSSGNLILEKDVSGKNEATINIDLASGIYFLYVEYADGEGLIRRFGVY
ncbi:T9SS type A sorting domain-containing protein [bacterium]|nr:T9SS type A sorting domain-containing protein [bacterium]